MNEPLISRYEPVNPRHGAVRRFAAGRRGWRECSASGYDLAITLVGEAFKDAMRIMQHGETRLVAARRIWGSSHG